MYALKYGSLRSFCQCKCCYNKHLIMFLFMFLFKIKNLFVVDTETTFWYWGLVMVVGYYICLSLCCDFVYKKMTICLNKDVFKNYTGLQQDFIIFNTRDLIFLNKTSFRLWWSIKYILFTLSMWPGSKWSTEVWDQVVGDRCFIVSYR